MDAMAKSLCTGSDGFVFSVFCFLFSVFFFFFFGSSLSVLFLPSPYLRPHRDTAAEPEKERRQFASVLLLQLLRERAHICDRDTRSAVQPQPRVAVSLT